MSKPASEFYSDKTRRDGLARLCKDCTKKDNKRRYRENAEARRAATRKWHADNKERRAEYDRKKYIEQREIYRERNKQYRTRYPEKMAAYKKNWRERNQEHVMELSRKNESARRARKALVPVEVIELDLIQSRVDYYGGKCWICKIGPYEHLDHVKPISKGGPHMLSNLRPACAPCNMAKGNKWPFTPVDLAA